MKIPKQNYPAHYRFCFLQNKWLPFWQVWDIERLSIWLDNVTWLAFQSRFAIPQKRHEHYISDQVLRAIEIMALEAEGQG